MRSSEQLAVGALALQPGQVGGGRGHADRARHAARAVVRGEDGRHLVHHRTRVGPLPIALRQTAALLVRAAEHVHLLRAVHARRPAELLVDLLLDLYLYLYLPPLGPER